MTIKRAIAKKARKVTHTEKTRRHATVRKSPHGFTASPDAVRAARALDPRNR